MSVNVIDQSAEDILYALLVAEGQKISNSRQPVPCIQFLQCRFFHIEKKAVLNDFSDIMQQVDSVSDKSLYVCSDGDIIMQWTGTDPSVRDFLIRSVSEKYGPDIQAFMDEDDFFIDYNFLHGRDKLKLECARKLKKQTKHARELARHFSNEKLISTLKKTVQLTRMQRALRGRPHILIVEDQVFSQKMLTSILKDYTCHIAPSTAEALLLYMEKCPDIVFLDIGLPDLSGHHFAKLINEIDDDSYIIVVSSSQFEQDIRAAKENNVKGFFGKPYEKKEILKAVKQYEKSRKKTSS